MIKKFNFSLEEIVFSLGELDLGCCWMGIIRPKYSKLIGFDNDSRGNGDGPFLELKCLKEYIKINRGDKLSKEEKKMVFNYNDYNSLDELADDLGKFIRKYFKSFKLTRKI